MSTAKKYAVLGYPAKHSLSPKIFSFLKEKFAMDFTYDVLEIAPDEFLKCHEQLKKYDGLNVTSPYKHRILEYCEEKSPEVVILGAANVLENRDGIFKAYNTDVHGFIESLKAFKIKEKSALVLGSSGAARAVVFALKKTGVKDIYLKARDMASFNGFSIPVEAYTNQKPEIVIQATTIGLNKDSSNVSAEEKEFFNVDYSNAEVCYDLIYTPQKTCFMEIAQNNTIKSEKNPAILNGKDMLILQALETFEIWTERTIDKKSILKELKEQL